MKNILIAMAVLAAVSFSSCAIRAGAGIDVSDNNKKGSSQSAAPKDMPSPAKMDTTIIK